MLPADFQPGNGRALRRFVLASVVIVPLWWSAMFVASMTPDAPRRIAIDLDGYFLPRYVHGSQRLAAHALPLWNADELAGVPFLGTGQGAVLYPPRVLLFGLLPPLSALHAFMVLHYVLLAVGSFVWLRTVGLGGAGAAFGAIVVTFQPFMMNGHYAPHWISNFAWTPWVLAAGTRALARPSAAAVLGLSLAAAMQVLAGYPEYAFDTALVLVVLLALSARDVVRVRGRSALAPGLLAVGAAAACTLLLTAVQWVPLLETARQSVRVSGDYQFMFGMQFDRRHFAAGLRGWVDALGILLYLPPVGWLLLAIGIVVPRLAHRLALAVLAFVCFAIPTWGHTVPPFSLFRGPLCWHSILHLPLAALAGAGLEVMVEAVPGSRAKRVLPALLLLGALAVVPLLSARAIGWLAVGTAGVLIGRFWRRQAGITLVLASALGGAWTWVPAARAALPHRYAAGQPEYPHVEQRIAEGAALRAACGVAAGGRVLAPRETWLGIPLLADVPTPQGYPESLAPRYTSALLDGAGLAPHAVFPLDRTRLAHAAGVLRLLDVRCIVLPPDWDPLVSSLGFERAGVLADGSAVSVRTGAGAFLPASVIAVPGDEDALAAVLAPGFDPSTLAVVVGANTPAAAAGLIAAVERPAPGMLRIATAVPNGGYLVVSETWYPGWRARVDGADAAVERADYAMLGVRVPPGAQLVELWYAPRGFAAARWATLAGALLLGIGAVGAARDRSRR